ncbi:hypothetical protein EF912_18205 [Streptomyces sp. WAC07061]|uniref:hypothetical protein n=1 Tax=Streptomyces sp. WAC07061 TaxID=2487410 RepID=UPI000F771657|nr:hypothetical protein [Streptomyces sp. WAC07061]RSS53557.1 hypothetical protein EF912_18205 [Streptomyces sp. WAC07061]
MNALKKILMGVAAVGLAVSSVVGEAGTAAAASNGQQIVYHYLNTPGSIPVIRSIRVSGTNQNGQHVTSRCFFTDGAEWTNLEGYWWIGSVSYTTYYNATCIGAPVNSGSIWVPKERTGDWVQITT